MANFENTIMGKITQDALMNWNGLSKEEAEQKASELGSAEKANAEVTYGSEINSINGIAQILGLSTDEIKTLTNDVNTREAVSQDLAAKVKSKMEERGLETSVIDVLSVIHDGWVQDNGNKFEDPKRMGKLYQFVDLKLLDYGEAKADLLFLQPILEASGIKLDEVALEQEFLKEQKEFLQEKGITNREDLKSNLKKGAEFYGALAGITTTKGKTAEPELITDRLQDTQVLETMTNQVAEKTQLDKVQNKSTVSLDQIEEVATTLSSQELSRVESDFVKQQEKKQEKEQEDIEK